MQKFTTNIGLWLVIGGLFVQQAWGEELPTNVRDPETAVATGVKMEQERHWNDAIDLYKLALKKWPDNANLTYGLRRSQFQFSIERRYDDLAEAVDLIGQ